MISLDVDQRQVPLAHRLSRVCLGKIAQACAKHVRDHAAANVSVSFVSDAEIRRFNRMYRNQDKVTDVLSFGAPEYVRSGQLGDVLISFSQARRQAENADIELELVDLLVHGILHLLGYDHERPVDADTMFRLQDKIVAESL